MAVSAVGLTSVVETCLPPFCGPEILTDGPSLTDRIADRATAPTLRTTVK